MTVDVYAPEVGQSPAELRHVVALYRRVKSKRVLEIGVLYGGTLREWIAGGPELVVAVDPDPKVRDFDTPEGTELVFLVGRSQSLADEIRQLGPYDWVFIDGDHEYSAVKADADLALEVTRPGGYILFHDIVAPEGWAPTPPGDVYYELAALDEIQKAWTIIEPRPPGYPPESANGIGVLQV